MRISLSKLKAMIKYFASFTEPRLLGKVKLMKLFYFADFGHVKKYGAPITYDNYLHLEHGPVPSMILNLVSEVESDADNSFLADTILIEKKDNSYQKRIIAFKNFTEKDEQYFSPSELNMMKIVCQRFADKTAGFIEDMAKKEAPYASTRRLEDIPYVLALKDDDASPDIEAKDVESILNIFGK